MFTLRGLRRYATNFSWQLLDRVFRLAANFITGILIARYLGPSDYGVLNYAISFASLFLSIAAFGLEDVLVRRLVASPERTAALLGSGFAIRFTGTTLLVLCTAVAAMAFVPDTAIAAMIVMISAIGVLQSANVIASFFFAGVQSQYVTVARTVQVVVGTGVKLGLIAFGAPLFWFAFALVVDALLYAIALVLCYRARGHRIFAWRIDRTLVAGLFRDAWPMIMAGAVVSIYMRIDQVMLMHYMDAAAVGEYAAAARISEAWYFLPFAFGSAVFPALLNARERDTHAYADRLTLFYGGMVVLSLAIALPVSVLAGPLTRLLFGEAYAAAAPVLAIHVWGGVFAALGIANGKWYVAEGLQKLLFVNSALGAVLNVGLNMLLIPAWETEGAAIATVATLFLTDYLINAAYPQTRKNFLYITRSLNVFLSLGRLLESVRLARQAGGGK